MTNLFKLLHSGFVFEMWKILLNLVDEAKKDRSEVVVMSHASLTTRDMHT